MSRHRGRAVRVRGALAVRPARKPGLRVPLLVPGTGDGISRVRDQAQSEGP
jgi:hypothetical protein